MAFTNCYADATRAEAYARLEFANTYYLAYRDLPGIIAEHTAGNRALDFGCGTGRSTRFARHLGFDVIGVDIAPEMIAKARELDPVGTTASSRPMILAGLRPVPTTLPFLSSRSTTYQGSRPRCACFTTWARC